MFVGLGLLTVAWLNMARCGGSECDKAGCILAGLVFLRVLTWDSLDNIQGSNVSATPIGQTGLEMG